MEVPALSPEYVISNSNNNNDDSISLHAISLQLRQKEERKYVNYNI